jgi:hypothetical protein
VCFELDRLPASLDYMLFVVQTMAQVIMECREFTALCACLQLICVVSRGELVVLTAFAILLD